MIKIMFSQVGAGVLDVFKKKHLMLLFALFDDLQIAFSQAQPSGCFHCVYRQRVTCLVPTECMLRKPDMSFSERTGTTSVLIQECYS